MAQISVQRLELTNVKVGQVRELVDQHKVREANFVGKIEYLILKHIPDSAVEQVWEVHSFPEGSISWWSMANAVANIAPGDSVESKLWNAESTNWKNYYDSDGESIGERYAETREVYFDDWGNEYSDEDEAHEGKDWNDFLDNLTKDL